ncbi:MAG: sigma-70 family RNA polymerase sigma factor [Gammaproteobacteria bacterium]|nr:sigma-70 family RNA polymerase sigma factor [Gammaproteobacteria bacterium]
MNNESDGELIKRYVDNRDEGAMRILVGRHYDTLYRRFRRELKNDADAEDCAQRVWVQVARNLDSYQDEGKFPNFLSMIASNMIKEHWRNKGTREKVIVAEDEDTDYDRIESMGDHQDPETNLINDELVDHLVRELIPALPSDQRAAWLLRHESEYWEPGKRLEWAHLAELNGLDISTTWNLFETARTKYMTAINTNRQTEIDGDELLVFLVWTQAQRAFKDESFSWDYFSELLGVPVNTMKTRYRSAQKRLAGSLSEHRAFA